MSIKIAYLILCHKDPDFVKRTALKLTTGTEHHVFIHVDAKSSITPFTSVLSSSAQIHLLQERVPVYWGGFNAIEATVSLLRSAMEKQTFERFVIMQGTDYPIKSNEQILDFFEAHKDTEFIKAVSETYAAQNSAIHKYIFWHHMDKPCLRGRIVNHMTYLAKKYWRWALPRPYVKINGKKCEIYRGWAQIALTNSAVRYILNFHDTHRKFNTFFKHVFAPDESYFHTIVYNSPFAKNTLLGTAVPEHQRSIPALLNLTYFEYPDLVKTFIRKEDYELLNASGYLFFRKATSESKELLDYIDKCHSISNKRSPGL